MARHAANDVYVPPTETELAELDRAERAIRRLYATTNGHDLDRLLSSLTRLDEERYADLIDILGRVSDES